MGVGSKLKTLYTATQQGINDSLKQVQQQFSADSLQQVKLDSIALAKQEEKLKAQSDSLFNDSIKQVLRHGKWKGQQHPSGVSKVYSDNKQLLEGIHNTNVSRITHEASTNIKSTYKKYLTLKQEVKSIHKDWMGFNKSIQQLPSREMTSPLNPTKSPNPLVFIQGTPNVMVADGVSYDSKFFGGNRWDYIWPSKEVKPENRGMRPFATLNFDSQYITDNQVRELTRNRMVLNNPKIKQLLEGEYSIEPGSDKVMKSQGLMDVIHDYDLDGESKLWANIKERFGSRSNLMKIIDYAMDAKSKNVNWFFTKPTNIQWTKVEDKYGNWATGTMKDKKMSKEESSLWMNVADGLSKLPKAESKAIQNQLQDMISDIWTRGSKIAESTDILMDEYLALKAQFPLKQLPGEGHVTIANDDLIKSIDYDKDVNSMLDSYKYLSGNTFNLHDSFNRLAIDSLGKDMDAIADSSKTLGGQELLMLLSEEIQQNRSMKTKKTGTKGKYTEEYFQKLYDKHQSKNALMDAYSENSGSWTDDTLKEAYSMFSSAGGELPYEEFVKMATEYGGPGDFQGAQ